MHPMNGDLLLDDDDLHSDPKDALETNGVASDDDDDARCKLGEAKADDIETFAMKRKAIERGIVAFMMVSDRVTTAECYSEES
mmetsp:Transcript_39486/g.85147  ORF Transcript_39486/g.85147 Transcript_39486/m.85147 type:complete len:83 (+) Transcript_39486:603-851(+)